MLNEIVVDTNVLAHCHNESEPRCVDALEFLEALLASEAALCADEGFSTTESDNRSLIGSEYLELLPFGSPGLNAVQFLASNDRLRFYPKRPSQAISRRVQQLLRNKKDRVFLGVAWHCESRILASHDFLDFSDEKRRTISSDLDIEVLTAADCKSRF